MTKIDEALAVALEPAPPKPEVPPAMPPPASPGGKLVADTLS
jgi:hypothetical protein